MNRKLQVSSSPHTRSSMTTRKIMILVACALLPACIVGVLCFGEHALVILALSSMSAVGAEYVYERILNKPITISDCSALVTGLLIGMNMPPKIAWWIPCLGSVFAIIVIKQLYGGLGQNIMNPALGARCFLLISFAGRMTDSSTGKGLIPLVTQVPGAPDALSGATPLAYLKTGASFDLKSLFLGNTFGGIGETSALALMAGGLFLVAVHVIRLRIPASYIGTFALLTLVTAAVRGYHAPVIYTLEQVCAGGLMLGAWFMATDYVTSPIKAWGQIVFGVLLGILTWIFRMVGTATEGVSYAIIFCNLLVPMIEHYTRPAAAGVARQSREARRLMREKAREARRLKAADRKEKAV